jgi:enoyl-CoA hydratase/3-hydroxyacyl-CoA dehydrogenase
MTIDEIQTVCFVGAGTMGCYNSLVAAISGYQVTIYDVDQNTLQQVAQRHEEMANLLVGGGYCTHSMLPAALERIALVADLRQATSNADLVSESIFERLDIKRAIHAQLDTVCPSRTILTTNSSALLVSEIETAVQRGERFAAMHSHLGAPLVDIVGGPRTSAITIDILQRYVKSTGGHPLVLKKEYPGYVLNAMLGPLLGSALSLVVEGVATVPDVDRAWMSGSTAAMGPFAMMDYFGVNVIYDSWRASKEDPIRALIQPKILALLQPMIDRGELGMKSGRGFYEYPEPQYQQADFLAQNSNTALLYNTLQAVWIGNAVLVAAHGVAEPDDIDRAWKIGTYLDTAPFTRLKELGVTKFLQLLASEVAVGRFSSERAELAAQYLRSNRKQFEDE